MKVVLFIVTVMSAYRQTKTDNSIKVDLLVNDRNVSNYQTSEGRSVNLTCDVSGIVSPRIKWHKDRINIKTEDFNSSVDVSQEYSSYFTIPEVTCEDGGNYICQAGNEVMQDEDVLKLDVKCPPNLSDMSGFNSNFTVSLYEDLVFSFNVTSNPLSTIAEWRLDSIDTSLTKLADEFDWRRNVSDRVQTFTLSHHNITEEKLGLYDINIANGVSNLVLYYTLSLYKNISGETTQQVNSTTPSTTQDAAWSNTTRADTGASDMAATIERLTAIAVGSFTVAVLLIVLCAAMLRCPCLRRYLDHLPCGKHQVRNPKIWVTMPSNDNIYHCCTEDEPVFGTGSANNISGVQFNHLKTSTSCNDLNNIHIQIRDYQDTVFL